MTDEPIECPRCGGSVPDRPFCVRCGEPLGDRARAAAGRRRAGAYAGYALLVRQLAERERVKGLGALGPTLYALAAAAPRGTVFHDVTRGGNLFDDAGVGG